MIYNKKIGRFKITVTEPSPMWTTITSDREDCQLFGINEDELEDLHFIIGQALKTQADLRERWKKQGKIA